MRTKGRNAVALVATLVMVVDFGRAARAQDADAGVEEPSLAAEPSDAGPAADEPPPAAAEADAGAVDPEPRDAPIDWAAAPLPTHASGIARPADGGVQWPRTVGRVVLFVPKWAFIIVASPVRLAAWSYERYQLRDRFKQIFFNVDGTFGIYPVAFFATGFGVNVGARLVHKDLFGQQESLRLKAGFGGIYQQVYEVEVGTGDRLGARFELALAGRFERRGKDRFYGIGNIDLGAEPGQMLDASAPVGVRSRFRQDVMRALVLGDLQLVGDLSLKLSGALLLRDFDASDSSDGTAGDDAGENIVDNYDVSTLAGFEQGVTSIYTELELRYDSRRRASVLQTRAVPAAGGLIGTFVGYQHGLGDDPAEFVRYGADVQWFFDLYKGSRVLGLRALLEGTARTGHRTQAVPFVDLPRLGGPQLLRGYDLDRFRDRVIALGSVEYTYDLGMWASAFAFVDAGRPYRKLADFELVDLRVGYGGGIQMHTGANMLARFHLASSTDGGLFVSLSLDPAFAPRARAGRM